MSRSCYNSLSDYTKNGLNPIIAPALATSTPNIFSFIKPHGFYQNKENLNRLNSITYAQKNCNTYATNGTLCSKHSNQIYEQYSNEPIFYSGFNDVTNLN